MEKQLVIDFLKRLSGGKWVEIDENANRVVKFNDARGKPQEYFCCWFDQHNWRCKDNDFTSKCYIPVDIDIRLDYYEREKKVLSHDEMMDIIKDLLKKIDWTSEFKDYAYAVCSGNGLHLYYVGDVVQFSDYNVYARGVEYMQWMLNEVIAPYKCDPAVKNIARIMRLPWTINPRKKIHGGDVLWDLWDYVCEFLVYKPLMKSNLVEMLPLLAEEQEKKYASVKAIIKDCKFDSAWDDFKSVDVWELASIARWVSVGHDNWDVIPLKESHKNMGAYIYKPYNIIVNTWSSLIHAKERKTFSPWDIVCYEMMNWDKKRTLEYFKEHYHIVPKKLKREIVIPEIEHSVEKWFLYPAPVFDDVFMGFKSEDLVTIVAEPNSWKTTFALDILTRNAEKWRKWFYVNLEFDIRNVWRQRWLSRNWFNKMNLTDLAPLPEDKRKAMDTFVDWELSKIDYVNNPNGMELDELIEVLSERALAWYELAVIDTLGDIKWNSWSNSWSSQNETMQTLQSFVQKTGMAVILLHHKNKRGEFSGSQKIKDYSNIFISVSCSEDADWKVYSEYELEKDKFVWNCTLDCYYNWWSYDKF